MQSPPYIYGCRHCIFCLPEVSYLKLLCLKYLGENNHSLLENKFKHFYQYRDQLITVPESK